MDPKRFSGPGDLSAGNVKMPVTNAPQTLGEFKKWNRCLVSKVGGHYLLRVLTEQPIAPNPSSKTVN